MAREITIYEIREIRVIAQDPDEAMAIYADKGEDAVTFTRSLEVHPERPTDGGGN